MFAKFKDRYCNEISSYLGKTYTSTFSYTITMDHSTLLIDTDQNFSISYDYGYNTD